MSWLKHGLGKMKEHLQQQTQTEQGRLLQDIRSYKPQPETGDDYTRLLNILRNGASRLAACDHFHEEALLLWNASYTGSLDEADKVSFIQMQLPTLRQSLEQRLFMVKTTQEARVAYFQGHDQTREKIKKRALALSSVRRALAGAVASSEDLEDEYEDEWEDGTAIPLDAPDVTDAYIHHLLEGISRFTTWQPVFAKIEGAESLAQTLAGYAEQADAARDKLSDWRSRCDGYFRDREQFGRERRQLYRDEDAYEHSGAFGHKPVFDFSRRGHRLEKERDELEDFQDMLAQTYEDLQDSFRHLCNTILDWCDALCEYELVLDDCLAEEEENNEKNGERLEAEYEAARTEIDRLGREYEEGSRVVEKLAALEEESHGI